MEIKPYITALCIAIVISNDAFLHLLNGFTEIN